MEAKYLSAFPKPLVEIIDTARVLIENHEGITEYCDQCISVRVKFGQISVVGSDLMAVTMTRDMIVITGCIYQVNLVRERGDYAGKHCP